jgi:alanine racemase
MGFTLLDVTDVACLKSVSLGDEVVIIGQQGDQIITVDELAKRASTIGYEITTCIGPRVPRVLVND